MLVLKIADYLYQRDIMPVFVIFPFTEWYNRYIDTEYKKEIYDLLDSLPIPVEFWDLNDYKGIFDDDDFCDTDHLNDKGAEKASVLLDEILKG